MAILSGNGSRKDAKALRRFSRGINHEAATGGLYTRQAGRRARRRIFCHRENAEKMVTTKPPQVVYIPGKPGEAHEEEKIFNHGPGTAGFFITPLASRIARIFFTTNFH